MPIYEFKCDSCGVVFEKNMKMSDPNPDQCESCGADKPRKIVSQSAFHLKGGGWYSDAYDGASNKRNASSSSPAKAASATPSPSTSSSSESGSSPSTSSTDSTSTAPASTSSSKSDTRT